MKQKNTEPPSRKQFAEDEDDPAPPRARIAESCVNEEPQARVWDEHGAKLRGRRRHAGIAAGAAIEPAGGNNLMKAAGAPGFESAFLPRDRKVKRRDADRLRIPNAARRSTRVRPRLLTENHQIALIWFDQVGPGAERAKPAAIKTDKITLIALIGLDPIGLAAKPAAIKTDKITLTTWIGFNPVGLAAKPPAIKTAKTTLIALIGFDPVGSIAKPSAIKTGASIPIQTCESGSKRAPTGLHS